MCSLQEAYNVPSFAAPKKRRCAAPQPQALASADPYDPYAAETGRGELARAPAPPRYGREDFVGETPRSAQAPPSGVRLGDRDKVTYKGIANDYRYYKEYGVDLPTIEPFNAPPASLSQAYLLPGETPPAAAAPAKGKRAAGAGAVPAPRAAPTCGVPTAQRYEIPISDEARRAYDAAFATALAADDESGATRAPRPEMRRADLSGVTGYYDPDLENYLETAEMASPAPLLTQPRVPPPAQEPPAGPYDPRASPFSAALKQFGAGRPEAIPEAALVAPAAAATTTTGLKVPANSWQGVWEILLFVIAGILVIFLCEQLFKLAVMVGMRQTMDLLEPYLDKITAPK